MTLEDLFGPADKTTGKIYADPLPADFRPTPELEKITEKLNASGSSFESFRVSLDAPEGYSYPTYQGSGTYLTQWVERNTPFTLHHSDRLYGSGITLVFSRKELIPEYDEHGNLISGVTKEMFNQGHFQ